MGRYRHPLLNKETGVYSYDELIVLRKTRMAAVLLEAGSIINRDEELKMGSVERRDIISSGVAAPALIRPIYGPDGRTASGLATWQTGGSVLFTSSDCTAGAHVYGSSYAGVRATTQVQTPAGIMLYVGAVGIASTVAVHSILYDTGCAPVKVQQNGLFPVLAIVNLNAAYPPPLAFQ